MKAIQRWLISIILLILLMISVGGITRITGSGLSITEWKPIMGAIPPMSTEEWNTAFEKYQKVPQFQQLNSTMTLHQFKWILFWEYSHRLLGRLIGIAFAIPFVFFLMRREIPKKWVPHLVGIFLLGGSQGALGWFMVKSGLSELSYVSHYRLAAHLILALLIASYILWVLKKMKDAEYPNTDPRPVFKELALFIRVFACLIFIQTVYGAFTAGLKAGYQFPTFPTMGGEWFPAYFWEKMPAWINLVANPVSVQWIHRVLGTLLVASLMTAWIQTRGKLKKKSQRQALTASAHLSAAQYLFGIGVVIFGVPVFLGAFHQILGSLLFLAAVNMVYEFPIAHSKHSETSVR